MQYFNWALQNQHNYLYLIVIVYIYFAALPMAREQTGDENFDVFKSVTGLNVYRIMDISKTKIKYTLFCRINVKNLEHCLVLWLFL